MSESQADAPSEAGVPVVEGASASIQEPTSVVEQSLPGAGQLLREAREAAGVDLATLAQALKVSVKKIEALEADAYDRLPDAVFTRALASSVCRALKIDAKPILDRMPTNPAPRLAQDEGGLNTPFQTPGDVAKTPFLDQLSRPMILAALAVLLGALVLVFFPSAERRSEIGALVSGAAAARSDTPTEAPAAAPTETSVPTAPSALVIEPVARAPQPSAAPVVSVAKPAEGPATAARNVAPEPKPAASAPVATPAKLAAAVEAPKTANVPLAPPPPSVQPAPVAKPATPTPAASSSPVNAVAQSSAAPAVVDANAADGARKKLPTTGVVVFKTTGPSWVNVTDAQGAVLLSRQVEPDEPVGVTGKMPLSVSIGRADLTSVTVRGQAFDLAPVTKQGVARFELK